MDWFFRQPIPVLFFEIVVAFVGLVVFVTVALDHPFQGAVTPAPDGFNLIADRPFGGLSRTGD